MTELVYRHPLRIHYVFLMATITLKNVPRTLYVKLTKRAAAHKRSLNQVAIACLEESLQTTEPVPGHIWEQRFQKVRNSIQAPPLTDDFLEWAVNHRRVRARQKTQINGARQSFLSPYDTRFTLWARIV